MKALKSLENSLEDVFVKQAPKLPANAKKVIVEFLPWITLVIALLSIWAVWILWDWAHTANRLIEFTNQLSAAYGVDTPAIERLTFGVWLALAIMVVQAVIYLAAFAPLRARKKSGWDLLFLGLIINLIYGVVILFTDYGGFGSLIVSLLFSAIGLYFLFQIRDMYLKGPSTNKSKPENSTIPAKKA